MFMLKRIQMKGFIASYQIFMFDMRLQEFVNGEMSEVKTKG